MKTIFLIIFLSVLSLAQQNDTLNYTKAQINAGLAIALDADVATYAGITPSANVQTFLGYANFAAMRVGLGLVISTNVQAYDADLTTYAGITPSANVQTFLGAATYAAMKTQLALTIGTNVQAYDADLTTYAGITPSANIQTFLGYADFAAMRVGLGLVIGTNVQAYDADLTAWAAINPSTGVIATTGLLSGGVVTKITNTSYTIGTTNAAELYGGVIYVTGAATITIPAVAAGASFTVITIGAVAVSVDPNASDLIILDGTTLADGDKATNTSTTGDIIVFTYYNTTGWVAISGSNDGDLWTDTN